MLDYKSIIFKRYSLGLNYKELTKEFNSSKSEINEFVCTFEMYEKLSYPLPEVFTNCYTTMSQPSTDKIPSMNNLISSQSSNR